MQGYNKRANQINQQLCKKQQNHLKAARARNYRNCETQTTLFSMPVETEKLTSDDDVIDEEPPPANPHPQTLAQYVLDEISDNLSLAPPARRYSPHLYDISWLLYLTAPDAYDVLRQLFKGLPAKQALYSRYSPALQRIKRQLGDPEQLPELISEYLAELHAQDLNPGRRMVPGTLGVDAFTFRSFQGMVPQAARETGIYNNAFLMLFTPLAARVPIRTLHLMPHVSGSHDHDVRVRVERIKEIAQNCGLRIWFKATDGDPGVLEEHRTFYFDYVSKRLVDFENLVAELWMRLETDETFTIPIADPLHVLKNLRARILVHAVAVTRCVVDPDEEEAEDFFTMDFARIRSALNIGEVLADDSAIGKMRDVYAVKLFNFQSFIRLTEIGEYEAALLFFPFACWTAVIWRENLTTEMRWFLVKVAIQILVRMLDEYDELERLGVRQRGRVGDAVVPIERGYLYRVINSLVAFGITLASGDESIRLGALGTHITENAIGIARQDTSDPRWECILTSFAHNEQRKRLAWAYNIVLYVSGRINDAGCKTSLAVDADGGSRRVPKDWDATRIRDILFDACLWPSQRQAVEDVRRLANQIRQLFPPLKVYDRDLNETANQAIMGRLIAFSGTERQTGEV